MDANQRKNYALAPLFIKYISDKYADVCYGEIVVPEGASLKYVVALNGKSGVGDIR